jgi:hypothetical protein
VHTVARRQKQGANARPSTSAEPAHQHGNQVRSRQCRGKYERIRIIVKRRAGLPFIFSSLSSRKVASCWCHGVCARQLARGVVDALASQRWGIW